VDWPHAIKEQQRNWIGRSEGAEVDFHIDCPKTELARWADQRRSPATRDAGDDVIRVFTTRRTPCSRDLHGPGPRASAGREDHDAPAAGRRAEVPGGHGATGRRNAPPRRSQDGHLHGPTPSTRSTVRRCRCGSPTTC
jgi:hypothetical protein